MTGLRSRAAATVDAALEATIAGSFTAIGYGARSRLYGWSAPAAGSLEGRTVLVTGATSGLGRATAEALAGAGARVVVLGRDPRRTAQAVDDIRAATGNDAVEHVVADLADLSAVRHAASDLRARLDRLDALVNNAGALTHEYTRTVDGLELTYQTHVVAPFLLVSELLPVLAGTSGSRVVTVSSGGMYTESLDVERVQMSAERYDGVVAYARAKRAQVVLNAQWARRTTAPPVFHAMHPGWADTPGVVDSLPTFHKVTGPFLRTPQQGADTIIWLASAAEPSRSNGLFWLDRRPRRTSYLPGTTTEPAAAEALWDLVRRDAGISAPAQ